MSQTLTLPDELFDRLNCTADQQGLVIEQLLAQWIAAAMPSRERLSDTLRDDNLLLACTQALLDGSEPPIAADWAELEAALQGSKPLHPTVEEAMSSLRSRPWTKDE